jgi:hypothetical protein
VVGALVVGAAVVGARVVGASVAAGTVVAGTVVVGVVVGVAVTVGVTARFLVVTTRFVVVLVVFFVDFLVVFVVAFVAAPAGTIALTAMAPRQTHQALERSKRFIHQECPLRPVGSRTIIGRRTTCSGGASLFLYGRGMCECSDHEFEPSRLDDRLDGVGRRAFLLGGVSLTSGLMAGLVSGLVVPGRALGQTVAPKPLPAPFARYGANIRPRADWAQNLAAKGKLPAEPDVRFLLVHHTASSNKYIEADVPGLIRGFYGFHTGKEKGWPDVAYNFFVDKYGTAWEGRTGSLVGAVAGSASGGNQGYSQLVCLIGDYSATAPSKAQEETVVRILSALADRHSITTTDGATASFVSRGSNKHKAGVTVSTPTINGHRSMSLTSCPGDSAFARLDAIRTSVHRLRITTK